MGEGRSEKVITVESDISCIEFAGISCVPGENWYQENHKEAQNLLDLHWIGGIIYLGSIYLIYN